MKKKTEFHTPATNAERKMLIENRYVLSENDLFENERKTESLNRRIKPFRTRHLYMHCGDAVFE
jgi:hypothetical protein